VDFIDTGKKLVSPKPKVMKAAADTSKLPLPG